MIQQILNKLNGRDKFFVCFNLIMAIIICASILEMRDFDKWGIDWGWQYQSYSNYIISSFSVSGGILALTATGIYFAGKRPNLSAFLLAFYPIYLLADVMLGMAGFINVY